MTPFLPVAESRTTGHLEPGDIFDVRVIAGIEDSRRHIPTAQKIA